MNRNRSPRFNRMSLPVSLRPWSKLRVRIAAAFGKHAIAVDPVAAQRRSNAFYRASGMAWASLIG